MDLVVQRLSDDARLPRRGSTHAAGYDLASAEDTVVPPRGKARVRTDLCIAVPQGTYGRIAPRSGLAANHFIDVGAGVIDEDYRGNVVVLLFNHDENTAFVVRKGDRIAQLVLERIANPDVVEVAHTPLDPTPPPPPALQSHPAATAPIPIPRQAGGFGSTGV
jgi:dUTP pyrophosphatase